jgi:hypothetical protein
LLTVFARRDGDEVEAERLLAEAERALQRLPPDQLKHIEDATPKIVEEARGKKLSFAKTRTRPGGAG